jgi:hypothetical protein
MDFWNPNPCIESKLFATLRSKLDASGSNAGTTYASFPEDFIVHTFSKFLLLCSRFCLKHTYSGKKVTLQSI